MAIIRPEGCSQEEKDFNESVKMAEIIRKMPLSNFTVGEFETVQRLLEGSDFHKRRAGMEEIRKLIKKHSKK